MPTLGAVHSQSKSSSSRTPAVGQVAKHLLQDRARNYHVPRRLQSRKSGKDAVLPSPRIVLAGSVHMTLFCISCSKQTRPFSPHKYHAQLCTIMHGHPCCFDCKKYARDGRRLLCGCLILVSNSPDELDKRLSHDHIKVVYHDTTAFSADYCSGAGVTLPCAIQDLCYLGRIVSCNWSPSRSGRECRGDIRKVPADRENSNVH